MTDDAVSARFQDKIRASPAEIEEIAARMADARSYLEYGAGGTTLLACESGIQRVSSIETDLAFCTGIIEKYGLRSYIDTGRLALRHSNLGKTRDWGFPVDPPKPWQIEEYLSWPSRLGPVDLMLIDGRYRVAVAACAYLATGFDVTIMIHDYINRPAYHVVEEFLKPVKTVEELTVFRKRPGVKASAARIREESREIQD